MAVFKLVSQYLISFVLGKDKKKEISRSILRFPFSVAETGLEPMTFGL